MRFRERWRIGLALCLLIAAAGLLISAGLPQRSDYTQIGQIGNIPIAPEIGAIAPPFPLHTLSETTEYQPGLPTVINFWATWCVPCEVEMPELQAFQVAHPDVQLIAVNVGESAQMALTWAEARGISLQIAFDPTGDISRLYAIRGMPTTFVISPDGIIRHIFYGATTQSALENQLADWIP